MTDHPLVAFITARLGEDQALAERGWSPLVTVGEGVAGTDGRPGQNVYAAVRAYAWGSDRLRLEVAAKRAILDEHQAETPGKYGHDIARCTVCLTSRGGWQEDWNADPWPCRTVRLLGAVWSDRPDYDPSWAPED